MRKLLPAILVLIATAFCPLAKAQETPNWEVYGGASYMNVNTRPVFIPAFSFGSVPFTDYSVPLHNNAIGWRGQVVQNVNSWFGGVADFSGSYANENLNLRPFLINADGTAHLAGYTFLFGPRFTLLRKDRVSFFAEGLVGGAHYRAEVASIQGIDPADAALIGLPFNHTSWAFAFGAGGDYRVKGNVSVRFEADFVRTHFPQSFSHDFQSNALASIGLVYRIGRK